MKKLTPSLFLNLQCSIDFTWAHLQGKVEFYDFLSVWRKVSHESCSPSHEHSRYAIKSTIKWLYALFRCNPESTWEVQCRTWYKSYVGYFWWYLRRIWYYIYVSEICQVPPKWGHCDTTCLCPLTFLKKEIQVFFFYKNVQLDKICLFPLKNKEIRRNAKGYNFS